MKRKGSPGLGSVDGDMDSRGGGSGGGGGGGAVSSDGRGGGGGGGGSGSSSGRMSPSAAAAVSVERYRVNDSACARMAPGHIHAHLLSLTRGFNALHDPAEIRRQVRPILLVLQAMSHSRVFSVPVDPVALGIPDYPTVVKRPMDLGTVARNVEGKGACDAMRVPECAWCVGVHGVWVWDYCAWRARVRAVCWMCQDACCVGVGLFMCGCVECASMCGCVEFA